MFSSEKLNMKEQAYGLTVCVEEGNQANMVVKCHALGFYTFIGGSHEPPE